MSEGSTPWDGVIGNDEEKRYAAAGFGKRTGFGERPALLIIDVQYRTVGSRSMPFWQSIEEYKTSCGDVGWAAVENIRPLLAAFRDKGFPVIYPFVSPKESFDRGRLSEKVPALMKIDSRGYDFVEEIAPSPGDILLPKKHPSAFFGTPLVSYLIDLNVDTVVVTGCTTSGCVRGTVVDAFAYNFKAMVPVECVYDRSPTSHKVNLFDMSAKYADILPVKDVLHTIDQLPARKTGSEQ